MQVGRYLVVLISISSSQHIGGVQESMHSMPNEDKELSPFYRKGNKAHRVGMACSKSHWVIQAQSQVFCCPRPALLALLRISMPLVEFQPS